MRNLLAGLLLVLVTALTASAHDIGLAGIVTVAGEEIEIRLVDGTSAPIDGALLTVGVGQPGKKPSRTVQLSESSKAVYTGRISPAPTGSYQLTLNADLHGEIFQGTLTQSGGQALTEKTVPMPLLPPKPTFDWSIYLYGGAVIVLATATAMALMRRRRGSAPESE